MNLLYPKVRNFRKIIPFMLIGSVIASIYGVIHDQLSYSISPEYFTAFKFNQFSYADFSLNDRLYVAIIGVLATWWFGAISGWFLGRVRFLSEDFETANKDIIKGFYIIFISVIAFGIIGGIISYINAYYFSVESFIGWERELSTNELKNFIVVSYIHTSGYIGGLVGIIVSTYMLKRKMNSGIISR